MERTLILGAGSAIARAILARLLADPGVGPILCISRSPATAGAATNDPRLTWLQSDYSETSMRELVAGLLEYRGTFTRLFLCNGILHNEQVRPEKRLEDLDADTLHSIYHANAVVPMLWLKHLSPLLAGERPCQVVVFSARIGSIADNRRGGWYSYRASKAALNMLLKTVAVEYARRAANVRFLAFHPGTTDTPLSKPFQRSVPADKLFTPDFVADQLLQIVQSREQQEGNREVAFLDWSGEQIPW